MSTRAHEAATETIAARATVVIEAKPFDERGLRGMDRLADPAADRLGARPSLRTGPHAARSVDVLPRSGEESRCKSL